jgi:hypothetical protein
MSIRSTWCALGRPEAADDAGRGGFEDVHHRRDDAERQDAARPGCASGLDRDDVSKHLAAISTKRSTRPSSSAFRRTGCFRCGTGWVAGTASAVRWAYCRWLAVRLLAGQGVPARGAQHGQALLPHQVPGQSAGADGLAGRLELVVFGLRSTRRLAVLSGAAEVRAAHPAIGYGIERETRQYGRARNWDSTRARSISANRGPMASTASTSCCIKDA